jgi:hypothetical protein
MTQELFESTSTAGPAMLATLPKKEVRRTTRNKTVKAPTKLALGGRLAECVAERAARLPVAPSKTEIAESVLGDVIDAMRKYPQIKLKDILADLRDLDPRCDSATVQRTIRSRLIELGEISRHPKTIRSNNPSVTGATHLPDVTSAARPETPVQNNNGLDIASMVAGLRADEFGA